MAWSGSEFSCGSRPGPSSPPPIPFPSLSDGEDSSSGAGAIGGETKVAIMSLITVGHPSTLYHRKGLFVNHTAVKMTSSPDAPNSESPLGPLHSDGMSLMLPIRWEQNGNSGQAGNHEEYASYDMQPLPRLRGLRLLIPSSRQKKSQIERSFAAALFFQMPRARLQ